MCSKSLKVLSANSNDPKKSVIKMGQSLIGAKLEIWLIGRLSQKEKNLIQYSLFETYYKDVFKIDSNIQLNKTKEMNCLNYSNVIS